MTDRSESLVIRATPSSSGMKGGAGGSESRRQRLRFVVTAVALLNTLVVDAAVILSWPLFAQSFQLEQSALGIATDWSSVPLPYHTNAECVEISLTRGATRQGFRLRK